MRKTFVIILLATALAYCSCHRTNPDKNNESVEDLSIDLKDSKTFKLYMLYGNRLAKGVQSGRYNKANLDRSYITAHHAESFHTLPRQELYTIYTDAKMKNAKEYIDCHLVMDSTYQELTRTFPVISKMHPLERYTMFGTTYKQIR